MVIFVIIVNCALDYMSLHTLKSLLSSSSASSNSLIAIDTVPEVRADELVEAACRALNLPFFIWSLDETENSESLLDALKLVKDMNVEAVFLFENLDSRSFERSMAVQVLTMIHDSFRESGSRLVLSGNGLQLPAALDSGAAWLHVGQPDARELGQMVDRFLDQADARVPFKRDLGALQRSSVISLLWGLDRKAARGKLLRALFDKRLSESRPDLPHTCPTASDLLELETPDDFIVSPSDYEQEREWARRTAGSSTPRNLLLTGGRRDCDGAAEAISHAQKRPLLKFDALQLLDFERQEDASAVVSQIAEVAHGMAPCVLRVDRLDQACRSVAEVLKISSAMNWLSRRDRDPEIAILITAESAEQLPNELSDEHFALGSGLCLVDDVEVVSETGELDHFVRGAEIQFEDAEIPGTYERANIWEIQLRLRQIEPSQFDLERLVITTEGLNGEQIEQIVITAMRQSAGGEGPFDTDRLLEAVGLLGSNRPMLVA